MDFSNLSSELSRIHKLNEISRSICEIIDKNPHKYVVVLSANETQVYFEHEHLVLELEEDLCEYIFQHLERYNRPIQYLKINKNIRLPTVTIGKIQCI